MKVIRASEIGTYLFCKRAWWYQLQGYSSENKVELSGGSEIHHQHGQLVATSNRLKISAFVALILAILTAAVWIIQLLF
jgi:CRISPR/Cas system-associated exonuclease Cas4 (RecB family)